LIAGKSLSTSEDRVYGMLTDAMDGSIDKFAKMELTSVEEIDEVFSELSEF
jgi:hypothetical protein